MEEISVLLIFLSKYTIAIDVIWSDYFFTEMSNST